MTQHGTFRSTESHQQPRQGTSMMGRLIERASPLFHSLLEIGWYHSSIFPPVSSLQRKSRFEVSRSSPAVIPEVSASSNFIWELLRLSLSTLESPVTSRESSHGHVNQYLMATEFSHLLFVEHALSLPATPSPEHGRRKNYV